MTIPDDELELVDTPPASTAELRRIAQEELRTRLAQHPDKWARIDDAQARELGGLHFGVMAESYGFDTHLAHNGDRYVRLTPTPARRRRPWHRRSSR